MELTAEQSQVVRSHPEQPQEITDPVTQRRYILLPLEEFSRLREEAEDAQHFQGWMKATQKGMSLALGDEE